MSKKTIVMCKLSFKDRLKWFARGTPHVHNIVDMSVTTHHILNHDTSNESSDPKLSNETKGMIFHT